MNLLFVEDDLNLGFVIKDQLQEAGYKVTWAQDGAEGLRIALEQSFDIAILDVMLPRLSGFELAEELIEHKPELPFLFLTAKAMLEDKIKGLTIGKDYLTKPFEFKELELRLENILSSIVTPTFTTVEEQQFSIGAY
jgi:DNA-binding response OmpR family regulator